MIEPAVLPTDPYDNALPVLDWQLRALTETIREEFQIFDKVIALFHGRWNYARNGRREDFVARTFHGRAFGIRRCAFRGTCEFRSAFAQDRHSDMEVAAAQLARFLELPNAYRVVKTTLPSIGPIGPDEYSMIEWLSPEESLVSELSAGELAVVQSPERLPAFLVQLGAWLAFADLFHVYDSVSPNAWASGRSSRTLSSSHPRRPAGTLVSDQEQGCFILARRGSRVERIWRRGAAHYRAVVERRPVASGGTIPP